MLTEKNLSELGVRNPSMWVGVINSGFDKYGIDTPLRQAMFLAQCLHESGNLSILKENLNYSVDGLVKIFSKYFDRAKAVRYARQPEAIASLVYANRMGNGPEASKDGWRYRGRGCIQTTGYNNYRRLSDRTGIDFVGNPELLEQPEYAIEAACVFWSDNGLNQYADRGDVKGATRIINGGYTGLSDRIAKYTKCLRVLNA